MTQSNLMPDLFESAHEQLHNQTPETLLPADKLIDLGRLLGSALRLDHVVDGAWALLQAGLQTGDKPSLEEAAKLAGRAKVLGHLTHIEIEARLAQNARPIYEKAAYHLSTPNSEIHFMARGLKNLNSRLLALRNGDRSRRIAETGPVVATMYLLDNYSANQLGTPADIASAAMPWQKRSIASGSSASFKTIFGRSPLEGKKIQFIPYLGYDDAIQKTGSSDPGVLRSYWREQYDDDITIIYGDVHLGNGEGREQFSINRWIAMPPSEKREEVIATATKNVLDELSGR